MPRRSSDQQEGSRENLALAELEAFARAFLSVLLTLFFTRIASDKPGLFQPFSQFAVKFHQRSGNAVSDGACLTRDSAAIYVNQDVELSDSLSQLQRLPD